MSKKHIPALRRLVLLAVLILTLFCLSANAFADEPCFDGEAYEFDFDEDDYDCEIILDDPIYFMTDDEACLCEMDLDQDVEAYAESTDVTPEFSVSVESTPQPDPTEVPSFETEIISNPTPRPPKQEPMLYDIPEEVLAADAKFATLMEEANKYIGYPYVWGGHCPATSFDCSGYVSYVFTTSGVYNTGGRGATGLYSICKQVTPEEARPGDLIFFQGTMGKDVDGITHVGIYVGNNIMIHCGNPIGYADLTEPFWQKHFYGYGRLY